MYIYVCVCIRTYIYIYIDTYYHYGIGAPKAILIMVLGTQFHNGSICGASGAGRILDVACYCGSVGGDLDLGFGVWSLGIWVWKVGVIRLS